MADNRPDDVPANPDPFAVPANPEPFATPSPPVPPTPSSEVPPAAGQPAPPPTTGQPWGPPAGQPYGAPVPPTGRGTRNKIIGLAGAGVLVAVVGGGWFVYNQVTSADRDETGAIPDEGDLAVTDLRTGDCVTLPVGPDGMEIEKMTAIPCAEEHDAEVFLVDTLPHGDFPGDQAVEEAVQQGCLGEFESRYGVLDDANPYDIFYLTPLEEGWEFDRGYACMVYAFDGSTLTGTVPQQS